MALRLAGTKCWISVNCSKKGGEGAVHVYCQSRIRGHKCPLDGHPGVKPFELNPACFEMVKVEKDKTSRLPKHGPQ